MNKSIFQTLALFVLLAIVEMHQVIGSWDHTTCFIDDFIGNIGQILTVCCNGVFFFQQTNTGWLPSCFNLIAGNHFS